MYNIVCIGEHQAYCSTEGIQHLSSICQLVHCLLSVENYIMRLHEAIIWEKLSSTFRKSTSKTAIKGISKMKDVYIYMIYSSSSKTIFYFQVC